MTTTTWPTDPGLTTHLNTDVPHGTDTVDPVTGYVTVVEVLPPHWPVDPKSPAHEHVLPTTPDYGVWSCLGCGQTVQPFGS